MIVFENVNKKYGAVHVVKNFSLTVNKGETLVLLGTSGSGKTTTMKMVNRLIEPSSGKILVDGYDVMHQDPIALRRKIGYAIQTIGLFPHLSVEDNIAIVPNLLKWPEKKISERIDLLLNILGLNPDQFRKRFPHMLSGGQKQRVGVARALAADPPIILMDEPFGALDPLTREQIQKEFIQLESEIKKTIIFVTHDIFEAVTLGDRIALMHKGELMQLGTPAELVEKPANAFVEQFFSQHRFQLSLLTKSVKEILKDSARKKNLDQNAHFLSSRDSFIDALDLFKSCGEGSLPVFSGKEYVGELGKKELLQKISEMLIQEKGR